MRFQRKHGDVGSPEYNAWASLKKRCYTKSDVHFEAYGGRGITVCPEWRGSYETFLLDMGRRPGRAFSIDRIDNDGPYSKENCRWATVKQQSSNRRSNRLLTIAGITKTVTEWAEASDVQVATVWKRLDAGWDPERALSWPTRAYLERGDVFRERDRRRARAVWKGIRGGDYVEGEAAQLPLSIIITALKFEREEAYARATDLFSKGKLLSVTGKAILPKGGL